MGIFRKKSGFIIALFLALSWALILVSNTGFCAHTFRPLWAGKVIAENQSYLGKLDPTPPPADLEVLDQPQILQMSVQYQDLTRNYEMRRKFGLMSPESEIRYFDQVSAFSKELAQQVKRHQMNRERMKLSAFLKQLRKSKVLKTVTNSVGIFGVIGGLYFGKSFDFSLGKDLNFSTWTMLSSKSGRVHVSSPWIHASLDVLGSAPSTRDSQSISPVDPLTRGDERFKFAVSKYLANLDFSSVVSYLGTSKILAASLIKKITPQLSFVLDTYLPLKPNESDVKELGKALTLSYVTSF